MKDNFSEQSDYYVRYRPKYPGSLYDFIYSQVKDFQHAWDCATGNGQVASVLCKAFKEVTATDLSEKQLSNAMLAENINYRIAKAEDPPIRDNTIDLVTVGQALHWFDLTRFYNQVKRILKPNGIIAVFGYCSIHINDEADKVIDHFHHIVLNDYWDPERKILDEKFLTIPFPFEEYEAPLFYENVNWTMAELIGYFNSWSSVQHYIRTHNINPVDQLQRDLNGLVNKDSNEVNFPIFLRMGRV